ncbi:hypothetical protein [Nitrospirillum pindoramense]|uniref:Uncharacterized protein n=1 Tax=Nitrospirillum amazonense TaxID=28077 RepID=A0A560H8G2_9PROT|nr:hypothetical protein [Nitrospirillum amazonense]TWB42588.1 hypothetical protein FBZ90_106188 [Nitrospirillum amazonense]
MAENSSGDLDKIPQEIQISVPMKALRTLNAKSKSRILADGEPNDQRLKRYPADEAGIRRQYYEDRYLYHLNDEEIEERIANIIANSIHISSSGVYSANNRYGFYWQKRLIHTLEEACLRGKCPEASSIMLKHMPDLNFFSPSSEIVSPDLSANSANLYRYDKIKYLKNLRKEGKIYLRCASTVDSSSDSARNDNNEILIEIRLPADSLNFSGRQNEVTITDDTDTINLKIYQKSDYYMFCLSQIYDWRLFGNFTGDSVANDEDEQIGCLVITDVNEFVRRVYDAANSAFAGRRYETGHSFSIVASSVKYYDPFFADECSELLSYGSNLSLFKRFEYSYQREFRFVIRPNMPDAFYPQYPHDQFPQFEREFIEIGNIEDISFILTPGVKLKTSANYLMKQDITLLASALGTSFPEGTERVYFCYSVERREVGRTHRQNLMLKRQIGHGAQVHQQMISIPIVDGKNDALNFIRQFYRIFDVREHGNHLIGFRIQRIPDINGIEFDYMLTLPSHQPSDKDMEIKELSFEFSYEYLDDGDSLHRLIKSITLRGATYYSGSPGDNRRFLTPSRGMLHGAEMAFLDYLSEMKVRNLKSYICSCPEINRRCSEFNMPEMNNAQNNG